MSISVNGKKIAGVGKPGKSAYQAAVDGGFSGTEEEFNTLLASMSADPPDASEVGFTSGTTGMSADNVQDAIEELFTSVSDGKSAIAAAVTDMGVQTAATDSYETMAENIKEIETGVQLPTLTNPATASDLIMGKQLINQGGEIVTGTIQEYPTGNFVLNDGTIYMGSMGDGTSIISIGATIPYDLVGRQGKQGTVSTPSVNFGNATAADVATGKTFTSTAGIKVTGTGLLAQTLMAQITGPYMDTFEMVGPGGLVQRYGQAILEQTPIIVPGSVIFISILANSGQRYIPSSNPGFSDVYWVDNITDNMGYQMSYGAFIAQYGQTTYQINLTQR